MNRRGRPLRALALIAAALIAGAVCAEADTLPARIDRTAEIARGKYLATVGDCVSCHTEQGGTPYAGGRPLETGFGTIFSPNITPDRATGIGTWTEANFYDAMHAGRDDQGHHLYPVLPYPWFTKVSRADVDAMKAYFDSLAPANHPNKAPQLAWWMSWRPSVAAWNLLNFREGEFVPDRSKSQAWNRGAYLVEGLGHCGDCHTPKRIFGGVIRDDTLRGGFTEGGIHQGWFAPNLGGDLRDGLGAWSNAQLMAYLKTGASDRTAAAGPMAEVVSNSTSHLSDADLTSMAIYLKDMPARPGHQDRPKPLSAAALSRGEAIFTDNCAACHRPDGGGLRNVFPTLMASAAIQSDEPASVIRIVLDGARIPGTVERSEGFAMPAFDWKLDDAQVADVVNYIRNAWGNEGTSTDASTVAKARRATSSKASGNQ